jgi:hypothetical protein
MTFTGLFPGVDFIADVELDYKGTVPGKISLAQITSDNAIVDTLWNLWLYGDSTYDPNTYGIWIDAQLSTDNGANWTTIPNPLDVQLERFDLVRLRMHVLLPDDPAYDNLSLDFTGLITVVQWNEPEET